MRQKRGDIWEAKKADAIVVTTNGIVSESHRAVMGVGTAYQATERFPDIQERLARELQRNGNHVYAFSYPDHPVVVTFPTKNHYRDSSSLHLIERSCDELVKLTNDRNWKRVVLPRPGCGAGSLVWKNVWPVLAPILDDRFIVMSP